MTRRIRFSPIIAPFGIYQRKAVAGDGYRPSAKSRFAVARTNPDAPWLLIHVQSGASVSSILPALTRKLTMTDLLRVAAAIEANTHLDFSAFDALPPVTTETTEPASFAPERLDSARRTANEMRRIAQQTLA